MLQQKEYQGAGIWSNGYEVSVPCQCLGSIPGSYSQFQIPANADSGRQYVGAQVIGSLTPTWGPGLHSQRQASACPCPGYCSHLGSVSPNGSFLSLPTSAS